MYDGEYISKLDAFCALAEEKYTRNAQTPYEIGVSDGFSITKAIINAIPAADVEPVRRGKWIYKRCEHYVCSRCQASVGGITTPYCPYCGATMDGGKANEH